MQIENGAKPFNTEHSDKYAAIDPYAYVIH